MSGDEKDMATARSLALLRALTQRFISDVQMSTGMRASVSIREEPDQYYPVFQIDGTSSGYQYVAHHKLDEGAGEEVLVRLADDWSEPVMEAVLARDGTGAARQWPKCPLHQHALNPRLIDGTACWSCDTDSAVKIPVGQIPGPVNGR